MSASMHIVLGIAVASLLCLPGLLAAWRRGEPLADRFRRWLLFAGAMGLYAIVPALLRRAGLPPAVWQSAWMNFFLLHPLLAARGWGGGVIGPVMLAGTWALAYGMLLLALRRCRNLERDE